MATTARVGAQLDGIIGEYERNGLVGDDLTILKAIRGVLSSLTETEIKEVIDLLQSARLTQDRLKSSESTLRASAGQKSIIVQLQHLLLEYKRQQILREIAHRFAELGKRQDNNMHEAIALAKATMGRDARRSKEAHRISLQLQSTEQLTISEEAGHVFAKLENVTAEMDGIAAEKPRAAVAKGEEGRLLATVTSASDDLKDSNLLSAAGNEMRARDLFVELSRMLRPDRNKLQILKDALQELGQAMEKQKQVSVEAKELAIDKNKDDVKREVEKHQMQVVDLTEMVREDVAEHAPRAASALKESIEHMQEARSSLNNYEAPRKRKNTPIPPHPVMKKQADALNLMAVARKNLEEEIARTEREKEQPEEKLQQMKNLLADVRSLAREQEMITADSKAMEPGKLPTQAARQSEQKAKTLDAQAKATPLLKPAAESLAEAAKQMDRAAQALAKKLDAPASQQAATDALHRAESQLAQEVAKLEKATQELARLDGLAKKVSELIAGQQMVQLDTAKAAHSPDPKARLQEAMAAARQAQLSQQTAQASDEARQPAPEAAKSLEQAESSMARASRNIAQAKAQAARQDQAEALTELQVALRTIKQKQAKLAATLGKPTENKPNLLAQAIAAVTKAQLEVNKAVIKLARPASLSESLKARQATLAEAVAAKAAEKPHSKALAQARSPSAAALAKLQANDVPAAIGEMSKAQAQLKAGKESTTAQLAKEQGDLKALATQMSKMSVQAASTPLDAANQIISPLASGQINSLPIDAQLALRQAQQALTEASAQAAANNAAPAQQSAQTAQDTLIQAASALALAQKGLGNQGEEAQQMAKAEGGRGESEQKGKGEAKGPGENKAKDDSKQGKGDGSKGNFDGKGSTEGKRRQVADRNTFIGLPARERNAILQSMGERYPEEFAPLVEQYLKNLSDASSKGSK